MTLTKPVEVRAKELKPVFELGFTNKLQDYTLKPIPKDATERSGWVALTIDNAPWLQPLIQAARFDDNRCDTSNLSCQIYDLRMIEGDFDNHRGVHTRDEMLLRCRQHLQILKEKFSNSLTVYQVMIHKTTGSYKIRFLYAGTLLYRRGFENAGHLRIALLEQQLSKALEIKEDENFELLMRGKPGKNRTRVFSAEHDTYSGDMSQRLISQAALVKCYKDAQDWIKDPSRDNLSEGLVIQEPKPTFHRSFSRSSEEGPPTSERSITDAIYLAPDSARFGAGTRWDTLPEACQYIGRCGYQGNEAAAWQIYQGLDGGSFDMREDVRRAKRDFFGCLKNTRSRPMERSGCFASEAPDELIFDKGAAFKSLYTPRDRAVLYAIAEDLLKEHFSTDGLPWQKTKAAIPTAFELAFSKLNWEKICPTTDRPEYLDGSITLHFGGKEKQHEDFKWVNSSRVLSAVARASLTIMINPETGREYNYLTNRHARCYKAYGSVERCLQRHLHLPGKDMTIIKFESMNDYVLLLDNRVVTPQNVAEQRQIDRSWKEERREREVDESFTLGKFIYYIESSQGNLLKSTSFDLKERIAETRDALRIIQTVVYRDRYKLLRLYKYGGSIDELREHANKLNDRRHSG